MTKPTNIEADFIHDGLNCVVYRVPFSKRHRCGYVGIPESHPLFGFHYSDEITNYVETRQAAMLANPVSSLGIINALCSDGKAVKPSLLFAVHGGLTYSDGTWPGMPSTHPKYSKEPTWWFGFDAGHCGDCVDGGQPLAYMIEHCKSLASQLAHFVET